MFEHFSEHCADTPVIGVNILPMNTRFLLDRLTAGWSPLAAALTLLALPGMEASAQLNIAAVNTAYTVNFDGTVAGVGSGVWAGTGFQPTPAAGRLDSDAWAVTGWSDGDLAFGGTRITAGTDYRRGLAAAPVATGGMYAFDDGAGGVLNGRALGVQPNATEFNTGTITLRIQNNTGSTLTAFDIAYNVAYRDDGGWSSNFNLYVSDNGTSYTHIASQDVVSPVGPAGAAWVANARSVTVSGFFVPNGSYFYIRWRGNENPGGSGARDEFALDDISVTGRAYTMVRYTAASSSVNENVGTTTITASIVNPDPVIATTVDVALTSGDATRINNYTTQTLTFPGGSLANQSLTITVTDNGTCDGDVAQVFTLQNIGGGISPAIGPPGVHTMTIDDDETAPVTYAQYFDGGVGDNWAITAGAGNQSAATGAGDTPANQRVLTAAQSWQVNNGTVTLDLGTISLVDWTGITLSARLSSTSTNGSNGADGADSVAFYVDVNGGGFPLDPDISVSGNSNRRYGYTATGIASTTAGTPQNFQCNFGGNGIDYSTVNITIPNGTSSIALRVIATNNDPAEVWNLDNVQVTGTLCSPVYYSRANGSEATATWSTARTGLPAPSAVTFNKNATMVVQNTHTVSTTNNASIALRNLNVETGGTLNLTGNCTVEINGPTLDVDGTLSATDDDIDLFSNELTSISGSAGTIEVNNMTLDGFGAIVTVNTLKIRGTLQLDNGDFNANSKEVQLISNASGTARLGPVAPTASYTDRLRIERYIPAGVTDWRLLCSPVANKTVADWTDDFYTAGFPGSAYPPFTVNGNPWPSVRMYDETNPGASSTAGLIGVASTAEPLTVGKGFAAWSGTTLNTTTAFTIDVRGFPTVASTPFSIPMSYTNTGNPTVDGLNLVGNPLPSPIDFSALNLTNVDNGYYIYDPGSGTNAAWDETSSIGTGGANGNIQSSQGFWLKANAAAPSVTLDESAKVLEPINGGIFSDEQDRRPMVRLLLSGNGSDYTDEAVVHFISGSPAFASPDMVKLAFSNDNAAHISTQASTGEDLVINAFGELGASAEVPVKVRVPVTGTYTIAFQQVEAITGRACVTFEDLLTNTVLSVTPDATYTFDIDATAPTEPARFVLHIGSAVSATASAANCAGAADGAVVVTGPGAGVFDFTLTDAQGTSTQVLGQNSASFQGLPAGVYALTVDGNTGCGALVSEVVVSAPGALEGVALAAPASCADATDGTAEVMIMGGTAPYTVNWSNGSTGEQVSDLSAGTYSAAITDANGCSFAVPAVQVGAGAGPVASFEVSATEVLVGEEVLFFNTGTYHADYAWSFGDGATTEEAEPVHVYSTPGMHTVTLTTTEGECVATHSMDILVSTSTGLDQLVDQAMLAWVEGGHIMVRWDVPGADAIRAEVLDATGRLVLERRVTGSAGRAQLATGELLPGAYLVRLTHGAVQRTFKVALIR